MGKRVIACIVLITVMVMTLCSCECKHEWADATCTEPRTCTKCEEIEGVALGHTPGEWKVEREASVSRDGEKVQRCILCQEQLDVEYFELDQMFIPGEFLFTPAEFEKILSEKLEEVSSDLEVRSGTKGSDDTLVCGIYYEGEPIALVSFAHKDDVSNFFTSAEENDTGVKLLGVNVDTEEAEAAAYATSAIIMACDKENDLEEAVDIGADLIDQVVESGSGSVIDNGMVYFVSPSDSSSTRLIYIIGPAVD